MKKNKFLLILLVLTLVIGLAGCGRGNRPPERPEDQARERELEVVEEPVEEEPVEEEPVEEEPVEEEPVEEEPVEEEPVEEEPVEEEPAEEEPAEENQDSGSMADAREAYSMEDAAELGEWVLTKKNGKDMELGDIKYRVTKLIEDQDVISQEIDAFNEADGFWVIDKELQPGMEF